MRGVYFFGGSAQGLTFPGVPPMRGPGSAAIIDGTDAVFMCSISASVLLGKMNGMLHVVLLCGLGRSFNLWISILDL